MQRVLAREQMHRHPSVGTALTVSIYCRRANDPGSSPNDANARQTVGVDSEPEIRDAEVAQDPEQFEAGSAPPPDEIRDELRALLEANDSRIGQVYRCLEQGLDADAIAEQLGVSTPGFVWNYRRTIRALLDNDLPTAPTVASAAASTFRSFLRTPSLSAATRSYLEKTLGELERRSMSWRRVLQAIYDLLRERNAWPTFRAVDLYFDRRLGIRDAQAALAAVPSGYLQHAWHSFGFYDNDEVRLTLRGIQACEGGPDDLELLTRFVQWLCEIEQAQDLADESDPVAESVDFAAVIGLQVEADRHESTLAEEPVGAETDLGDAEGTAESPAPCDSGVQVEEQPVSEEAQQNRTTLARLRVLAELLPRFWSGFGWQEPWRWRVTIDRRGLRPYREISSVSQLLDHVDREREALTVQQVSIVGSGLTIGTYTGTRGVIDVEPDEDIGEPPAGPDEIDVLLTVLRPEITEAASAQLRGGLFDDAIFAAYRRVEAAVQERSSLTAAIGDQLVQHAFKDASTPIRVSARTQDADRLIQLFGGAIGLYKGDRSHKDKPALPCRSLRECLRQLANASALLDLLDRDIATAPAVRGYDQRGDTLELWVERASAQAQVWLDDRLCDVVRHVPGSLILDVAGVPAGEHELFVADGTRTGPVTQVWLTRSPGGGGWQRVSEVNIPLFDGPTGLQRLQATGLRLTVRQDGVISERIVPTTGSYRVGDYVSPHSDVGTPGDDPSGGSAGIGPAWISDGPSDTRRRVWEFSALFDGQPYAPEHEPRLMKITLEPPALILRPGDKAPIRSLGHYTDGVATWTDPLTGCAITSDNDKIVHVRHSTVFAKGYGQTALRLTSAGLYAAAAAHVADHPMGTMADVLNGLPPVAGLAWADDALIVSTRTDELWKLGGDGQYALAAAVPLQPPAYGGTDKIAAAENGDLAMRLLGHRDVLVLDKAIGYRKSRWVAPGEDGTVMAMVWDGADLILALNTGSVRRAHADGSSEQITVLPSRPIVSINRCNDALLALTTSGSTELWRISLSAGNETTSFPHDRERLTCNVIAWLNGSVYFTDFDGGRVLRLAGKQITEVTVGLQNPGELAAGPDGSIYVAEFGRGAVRRLLP